MRAVKLSYNLLRGGAYYAKIAALQDTTPTLRMSDGGEIKTSLTGSFAMLARDADGKAVEYDFLTDEIQPVLSIDGAESPLGVFGVAKPTDAQDGPLASVSVQCYDRCWRVRDTRSARLWYWPAGTRYIDAIEQLLTAAGIKVIFAVPSEAVFSTAREDWPIGESHLTIVNDLLREINYKELYFDATGAAVLEPAVLPLPENVLHILYGSLPGQALAGTQRRELHRVHPELLWTEPRITRSTDVYQAPNAWIVTCQNPDKAALMVARSSNTNPQSPLSIPRRGREITSLVSVNNIPSQAELQAYADRLRNDSMTTGETIEVSTALSPKWGVNDAVQLFYGDLSAICISRGYSMELRAGGAMSHTLERVVYNLD